MNHRIVVVGASDTSIALLEALVFWLVVILGDVNSSLLTLQPSLAVQ